MNCGNESISWEKRFYHVYTNYLGFMLFIDKHHSMAYVYRVMERLEVLSMKSYETI